MRSIPLRMKKPFNWLSNNEFKLVGLYKTRGGGGKRRGVGPRNDVLVTCKAVNPRASQRPSKAAVCFLMISTLALSVEYFLKNSVYFLLQQKSIMVVSLKALIFFRMFDYFALGKSVKLGRNSTSLEM